MKRFGAVLALWVVVAVPSDKAAQRTFVSSSGLDTNLCSLTAPCRSFTAALVQTAPGGVIVALDTAGYGPVTIGQSVSLIAPNGIYAGITATTGNAITLSGTTSSDHVLLRGLSLEGTANYGIQVFPPGDVKVLHVQRCLVRGFANAGIQFSSPGSLLVTDTLLIPLNDGINVFSPASSFVSQAFIDRCRVIGGGNGYHITNSWATLTNSIAAGNVSTGIWADNSQVTINHCEIAGNGIGGVNSVNLAHVRLANSVVTDNGSGLLDSSSELLTMVGDATVTAKTNVVENNSSTMPPTGTFQAH